MQSLAMDIVGGKADEESRVMEFSSGRAFSPADKEAIRLFNASIDQKQMALEYGKTEGDEAGDDNLSDGVLRVLLREVDIYEVRRVVQELSLSTDILERVLKEVEGIKSYGIKGKKRKYAGYNKERKVQGRAAKVEKRGQYFYARDANFTKENNTLPEKYCNKIICGDSESILRGLEDNCIDLIFTSPPYNFGLDYKNGEDDKAWQGYFDKLFSVFDECIRVLKYGGRIVVNVQPLFSDYIPSHHFISHHFLSRKMIWKGEILWEKNNYNCKYTAWGSWRSPSNPYFKYTWEFLEVFCKGVMKKEGKRENSDLTADEFKKWVVGKWSIAPERGMKEYGHPAMFPEELAKRVIKLFSYKGDVVLDPFNGVGTTCAVAKKLERRYLGLDIASDYCKKASKRLDDILL